VGRVVSVGEAYGKNGGDELTKQAVVVSRPTSEAVYIGTKPAAGVIPTRPLMMPEQKPRMENLPEYMYSRSTQPMPPPQAARLVLMTT
jgi:hypothetical protein